MDKSVTYGKHTISLDYIERSVRPRVAKRIRRDDATGCDVWTGRLDHEGYVTMSAGVCNVRVHRLLLILDVGPLAPEVDADHACRNRACIRIGPDHVRPLVHRENVRISTLNHPGHTEASRKAATGRIKSPEERAKISAAARSRPSRIQSPETRAKIRDAALRREARKREKLCATSTATAS